MSKNADNDHRQQEICGTCDWRPNGVYGVAIGEIISKINGTIDLPGEIEEEVKNATLELIGKYMTGKLKGK